MEAYDTSGLEAELAKANLNPLAGRIRTPDSVYSRNKIIENSHGTSQMKPRTPMRDVGADLASELAQMRVNMVQSRVEAETAIWGPSETSAEDAKVLMGGGGGALDSFLDSSIRAAGMEQARIDAAASPLERATAKYKEEVAKMRSRLANAKAEAANSRNSSSQLAIGGPAEKLMLTDSFERGRLSMDRSYEDSEEDGDYYGARPSVRESLGARWAKWGSPSSRDTSAARGTASRGHNADRSLRESWEDLHNGPMSRKEAAERPGSRIAPSLDNASDAAKRLARHLQTDEDNIPESLRLNSALHSWRQLEAVAELCRSVPGILDISLADNNLGVEAAAAVAKVLRAAAPSLAALDLSNNALKLKAMQVISSEFGVGSGLQQLFLGGNPLGDKSLHVLSSSLQGGRALLHLDLSRADLTFAAAEPLGELFAAAPSLRILDLSWNRLGGRGGRALARALTLAGQDHGRRGLGLASLRLAHTGLGDDGAAHIVLSLLQNHSLEELDLGSTKAGLATCKSLAYVLAPRNGASSSLARLGLTDNPLGCNGAAVLLRAVAQPGCHLEELALEQASFLDVGIHEDLKPTRRVSDDSKKATAAAVTAAGKAAALRRTESSKESPSKSSAAQSASSARLPSAGRRRPMSAMSPGLQATVAAGPDTAATAIKEIELQPGSFQLELEEAASRLCMLQLLDAVADGSADLKRVKLSGKRVSRDYGWETWKTEMPDAGVLELEMVRLQGSDSPNSVDEQGLPPVAPQLEGLRGSRSGAEVLPIRQDFIENMCSMLEVVGPLDEWRLQLVRMMCCAGLRATAQQALQLTMSFGESMGKERGQAAGCLVENVGLHQAGMLLGTLEEILMPSEAEEAKAGMERLLDAARRAAEAAQHSSEDDEDDDDDDDDEEEDSLGLVVRKCDNKVAPVPQKPKAGAPSGFGVRERTMSSGKPPAPKKVLAAHLPPPAAKLRSRRASGGEQDARKLAAAKPLGKAQRRNSSGASTKPSGTGASAAGGSSKKIPSRRASNASSSESDASRVHLFAALLDSPSSAAKSAVADAAALDRYHPDGAGYDDPLNRTYSSSLTDDSRTEYRPQASTISPDVSMQAAAFFTAKNAGSMMPPPAFDDDRYEE